MLNFLFLWNNYGPVIYENRTKIDSYFSWIPNFIGNISLIDIGVHNSWNYLYKYILCIYIYMCINEHLREVYFSTEPELMELFIPYL